MTIRNILVNKGVQLDTLTASKFEAQPGRTRPSIIFSGYDAEGEEVNVLVVAPADNSDETVLKDDKYNVVRSNTFGDGRPYLFVGHADAPEARRSGLDLI